MIQIYLVIAAIVAAVGAGGVFYIRELQAENKVMTQAYAIAAQNAIDNKAALDGEIRERKRVDGILADRELELADLARRRNLLERAMDDLKRNSQVVRSWSDSPVPGPVLELLERAADAGQNDGGQAVPADTADPGNPHPGSPDPK